MKAPIFIYILIDVAEKVTRGASKTFGLPFDLDFIAPFYVLPTFEVGLERVLCGIKRSLDKPSLSAPLVPILATLMLHFLEEWEVFAGLSNLIQRRGWIDHDESHLTTSTNMLLYLMDQHMVRQVCVEDLLCVVHHSLHIQKSTVHSLQRLKPASMSMDAFLRELVERWYTWPFYLQPFWITVSLSAFKQ